MDEGLDSIKLKNRGTYQKNLYMNLSKQKIKVQGPENTLRLNCMCQQLCRKVLHELQNANNKWMARDNIPHIKSR